jgi:hypothetical protein
MPRVSMPPGLTAITVVPNWLNCSSTDSRVPSPIDARSTTAATPMTMARALSA